MPWAAFAFWPPAMMAILLGRLAWCLFTPMVLLVVYVASIVAATRFR